MSMTKKELVNKLDELAGKVDLLVTSMRDNLHEIEDVFVQIENLPTEPDEIVDSPSDDD